jgi:hypothetical protein
MRSFLKRLLIACLLLAGVGTGCSRAPRPDEDRGGFRDRMKRAAGARSSCEQRAEAQAIAGREPARTAPDVPVIVPTGETVTFGSAPPVEGLRCTTTSEARAVLDVLVSGRRLQSTTVRVTEHATEVQEVVGAAITRLQVAYARVTATRLEAGKELTEPSPIHGKTYRLAYQPAGITATDREGRPVAEAERAQVVARNRDLGIPDRIQAALPRTPVAVGDRMDALAAALGKLFAEAQSFEDPQVTFTVDGVSARLKGRTGTGTAAVAVIAVSVGLLFEGPQLAMRAELVGELGIQIATGWLVTLTLDGPMHVGGYENAGRMTDRMRQTCTEPPRAP